METKLCPFVKDECRREECMLFDKTEISHVSDIGYCVFYSLVKELRALNNAMDKPGKHI